jgi:hypothetical protein
MRIFRNLSQHDAAQHLVDMHLLIARGFTIISHVYTPHLNIGLCVEMPSHLYAAKPTPVYPGIVETPHDFALPVSRRVLPADEKPSAG